MQFLMILVFAILPIAALAVWGIHVWLHERAHREMMKIMFPEEEKKK